MSRNSERIGPLVIASQESGAHRLPAALHPLCMNRLSCLLVLCISSSQLCSVLSTPRLFSSLLLCLLSQAPSPPSLHVVRNDSLPPGRLRFLKVLCFLTGNMSDQLPHIPVTVPLPLCWTIPSTCEQKYNFPPQVAYCRMRKVTKTRTPPPPAPLSFNLNPNSTS